ncbi:cyclophilin-like fold protein [Enterococcus termitis]|nr:cyclophilin-like fold protein [Enterococcus termitis]
MNNRMIFGITLMVFLPMIKGCKGLESVEQKQNLSSISSEETYPQQISIEEADKGMTKIEIEQKIFSIEWLNNPSSRALQERFPLTLTMDELNSNEKYSYLSNPLPVNPEIITQIEKGDIMLFGSECLVLFYDSFSTNYSYTPLGKIRERELLNEVLDHSSIEVRFTK